MNSILLPVLALASVTAPPAGAPADLERLPYHELAARMERLADVHPSLVRLETFGTSAEGRALHALRLTAADEPEHAPAILLAANLEGPRVFESSVVLHHAEALAAGYEADERVRALLDGTVVWMIPRVNPDAAEGRFATPLFERWTTTGGIDNDRDGREGEDGPVDLNGDGVISQMRVADPEGTWRISGAEPRVLVEADRDKGERGSFKLYVESRDVDGDDEPGEDPAGDTRVDRNFPAGWEAHAPHAGAFATSEPESLALCDFVIAQKNLALVVLYDGLDNLVETPKGVADDARPVKRIPPPGVLESDARRLAELGERYRDATENEATGDADDAGSFARWCYEQRGLMTLSAVLWNLPDEAPEPEEEEGEEGADEEGDASSEDTEEASADEEPASDEEMPQDGKHLQWIDGAGEAWRFIEWTPFDHPELGPIEIGGFSPYARLEPPLSEWEGIATRHYDWFVGLGELLPRVALVECTREALADGLWKVVAVVENDAYLPVLSSSMKRTRTTRPPRVVLEIPEGAAVLSGRTRRLVRDLPGSGGREELEWLIRADANAELRVTVDSDHAGVVSRTAEVKS